MENKKYSLPNLPYSYNSLEPWISEQQLTIHHQKHHLAYVSGANAILEKINKVRQGEIDLDIKAVLKELSFNIGGHQLHSLFWENLGPEAESGGEPTGKLGEIIKDEFGGFERFKIEFSQTALSLEGSGWAVLTYSKELKKPLIMQIEKHNTNIYPIADILIVLDMFEHAYYIDYKNEKAKFIDSFWNIVNWNIANKRLIN